MGPKSESVIVIMPNGHVIKLLFQYFCLYTHNLIKPYRTLQSKGVNTK